jgi:hypothetical protein
VVILAVVSDLHVNSTVALSPDKFDLDDGGTYHPSSTQRWINERWAEYWQAVSDLKDEHKSEVVVLINGELADDNYHSSTQLTTKHKGDQAKAALKVLELPQLVADRIIVTRGSEAHVGLNASFDESLAKAIGAVPDASGRYARWEFIGQIAGVRIDAAHHPGTGSARPWTRGAAANRLAQMVIDRYVRRDMLPPHLVLRGHNHNPEDSYDNHPARAIITPAWQLNTSFGYRIGGGLLPIGGLHLLLEDGRVVGERKHYHNWPLVEWSES